MENIAYTKEYHEYRKEQEAVFRMDYLRSEKTMMLSPHYLLVKYSYGGVVGKYTLHATENKLLDRAKTLLYIWKNLDDTGEFCKIIEHRNGYKYLIFRSDLYGYSVLNLTTLQDFHYVPSKSFPSGETFIWTNVFYNEKNNLLAVSGCYWACPFGTVLVDFSHPMKESGIWVDVQEQLEDGYDRYDDVDFIKWSGTDLILSAFNNQTQRKEIIFLSEDQYMKWITGK